MLARIRAHRFARRATVIAVLTVAVLLTTARASAAPASAGVVLKSGDFVVGSLRDLYWLDRSDGLLKDLPGDDRFDIPAQVATGPSGEVYVVDNYYPVDDFTVAASVVQIDPATGANRLVATGGLGFVSGFASAADGTLYTADEFSTGQKIDRINPLTGARSTIASYGLIREPSGLAVEANGSILTTADVTSSGTGPRQIIRIRAGTFQQEVVSTGGSLVRPQNVAVGPDGTIFVIDAGGNFTPPRVLKVHPQTGAQSILLPTASPYLIGIVVDSTGTPFMTGSPLGGPMAVYRVDAVSGQLTPMHTPGTYISLGTIAIVRGVAVNCSPRPRVQVHTSNLGSGRLLVTLTTSGEGNTIRAVRSGASQNASLVGQPALNGAQAAIVVQRNGAGYVTLPITVTDACGEWSTFVGGGPSAF